MGSQPRPQLILWLKPLVSCSVLVNVFWYNINIMRQSVYLILNLITVNSFAPLFNCTPECGRQIQWWPQHKDIILVGLGRSFFFFFFCCRGHQNFKYQNLYFLTFIYFSCLGPELFCLLLGPLRFKCWFSFAPGSSDVLQHPRDLQVSIATRCFCWVLNFVSS